MADLGWLNSLRKNFPPSVNLPKNMTLDGRISDPSACCWKTSISDCSGLCMNCLYFSQHQQQSQGITVAAASITSFLSVCFPKLNSIIRLRKTSCIYMNSHIILYCINKMMKEDNRKNNRSIPLPCQYNTFAFLKYPRAIYIHFGENVALHIQK